MYRQDEKNTHTRKKKERKKERRNRLDPAPTTRVHTGETIILGVHDHGIGVGSGGVGTTGLALVVPVLVLLDVLGLAMTLLVEFLVFGDDLGFAVFGIRATTAGAVQGNESVGQLGCQVGCGWCLWMRALK